MTKRLPLHVKLQRKPISRACVFCHTKHLQCDSTRPCKNCVKRNVADSCQDVQRKRSKPKSGKPKESKRVKLETSVSQPEQVVNSGSNFDTGHPSVIEQVHQKEAKQESSSSSSGISSPLLNIPNSSTLNMPDNNTLNNQTLDMLNIAEVKGLLDNHLNGLEKDNFGVSDKNKFYIGSPTGLSSRLSVTNLLAAQELFSNESNERNATQQNSQSTNDPLQHLSAIQLDRTASPVDDKSSKKSVQDSKKDNEEESGIINNVETDYNIFNSDFTNNFSIDTQNNNPIQDGNQDGNLSNLFYDGLNNQMIFRPFIKLGKDYNNNNDQSDFSVPSSNEEQINQHHHINNATPNNPDSLSMGPNSSATFGNIHTESPLSNTMYENQFNEHPEEFQQYTQPLNLVADKPPFLQQPHQQYSAQPLHTLHQHPLETQPRLTVNELINNFKRKEAYKSPLLIRKKVFQEVGDIYSKFPVFDLNRLLNGSSNTHGDNPYQDLRYVIGILSFSYMKSYQELIKYFYDRFYLQSVGPYNYDDMTEEEREKTKNSKRKLFFKVLEKIWLLHNYFRIQSALIQTDLTQLTNFSDSLMTELTFHRQLLNFESMINNYTSTPAIIWRRSTEIVFVSDEICALIGIKNKAKFLSKRRYLCEIIDDMSILNYFKLFNNVVLRNKEVSSYHNVHNRFDRLKNRFRSEDVDDLENELSDERINNGSKMLNGGLIRFNCKFINQNYKGSSNTASSSALDTKNHSIENFHAFESTFHKPYSQEINEELEQQQKFISSSSILTIKKDMFDIPMLIVGQFLPILE